MVGNRKYDIWIQNLNVIFCCLTNATVRLKNQLFKLLVKRCEVQKISRHLQNRVKKSKYQKSQGTHSKETHSNADNTTKDKGRLRWCIHKITRREVTWGQHRWGDVPEYLTLACFFKILFLFVVFSRSVSVCACVGLLCFPPSVWLLPFFCLPLGTRLFLCLCVPWEATQYLTVFGFFLYMTMEVYGLKMWS